MAHFPIWQYSRRAPKLTMVWPITRTVAIASKSTYLIPLSLTLRYHFGMIAKLTKELAAALNATGECELEVVDPETQRTYFLVDGQTHRRAMEALRRQRDRDAIAEGLVQMEQGQGKPSTRHFR